jgi:outer membrane protein insertion porin family
MKNFIAVLFGLFAFIQLKAQDISYEQPREYEIAEINVLGHKYYSPDAVISVSGLRVGDKINIPGIATSTAIKKIYDLGIFSDIEISATKIEGEKIHLLIEVRERPRLSDFIFKGIRKGETESLRDKIKFLRGQIVNDSRLKNLQLTVRKFFVDKGFFNTTVNIRQIEDSLRANSIKLLITVDKKEKVKINDLIINGNTAFTEKKIQKKLKNTKQKKFTRVFTPSKYIAAKYEEDKQKLIKFYNAQGYRDFRILSDSVYRFNDKTINVVLNVEEGRKYYYRNITWQGNYVYTSDVLSNILGIKKGDVYNLEELEKSLSYKPTQDDITSLYMDRGYLAFQIDPVEVAVEGDSIDVELRLSEGKQFDISGINISGNDKTSDHVILREILTIPGQKFSRSDIIQTQQRLSSLGYFNPEKIDIQPVPDIQNGTVDINYKVEERPSDQIELSGGWGGYYGFVGTLGLTFNNFSARKILDRHAWRPLPSGDGQRLSLRFQANGKSFQTYSVSFTEPWLGGRKPNSLSVSLSHTVQRPYAQSRFNQFLSPNITGLSQTGSLQISSISLGLGRRLNFPDPYFSLANYITYQRYQLKDYRTSLFSAFTDGNGTSNTVAFNTTLSRNSIDNPIFERNGSSISLSVSLTPPWSALLNNSSTTEADKYKFIEYHKWMFDAKWFTPVVGKLIFSARTHMGYIGKYGSSPDYTPFERFSLGGSGFTGQQFNIGQEIIALRGYVNNALPSRNASQTTQSLGGIIYNKYVMEMRYPVSLNPSATIYLLTFVEGGNAWNNYETFNPFKLYKSAGIGARIFMPAFGLIGIDFGKGFDAIPGYTTTGTNKNGWQAFQFSIGQQIR